ncbi:Virulence plasmid protein pGP6-D-related protein [Waddlia chondrophila 2032/99]|uniref:Virulence plasmid protein pGP6-D-related protein n=1 Tax=Waddlia chondrophila 2032/99 TaxID=765953 RepID=F8LBF0_9BACT|nr:Virulence plasmid protein pGP6-D-related protein [Waddlia chondrophila 2032/99]
MAIADSRGDTMSDVNQLLTKRLNKTEKSSKMAEMAKQSARGNLSSFSGIFTVSELNQGEKDFIEAILYEYSTGKGSINTDFSELVAITSEVKAINHQAALLHGERIKKAHRILTNYQEGAFTSWLIAAYGNRQTPYNFLQYYEFYSLMPKGLHPQIEAMPRQAVYTLASREGELEKKQQIVENYNGETKSEVLHLIRETFPLADHDKRRRNIGESTINSLYRLIQNVKSRNARITKSQKNAIFEMIDEFKEWVEECKTR